MPSSVLAPCRHCSRVLPTRARGLCFRCRKYPAVRDLYAPVNAYGRRGVGKPVGPALLPTVPTSAPPGSPEKLATLSRRAERGELLFHPADATFAGPALSGSARKGDSQELTRTDTHEDASWVASGRA